MGATRPSACNILIDINVVTLKVSKERKISEEKLKWQVIGKHE